MNGLLLLGLAVIALYSAGLTFDLGFTRRQVALGAVAAVPVALIGWLGLVWLFALKGWPA